MNTIIKSLIKATYTELKIYLREPLAAMMSFIMPLFFLLIIMEGIVPLKDPCINQVVPSMMLLVTVSNALYILPVSITSYRSIKYFTRVKASSLSPLFILLSIGIANFVMTFLGIMAIVILGISVYGAEFDGTIFSFSFGFFLTVFSMASIGFLIASLCRTVRDAEGVGELVMFVMMFFSGLFIPLEIQPDWVGNYIAPFLPTSYGVELLKELWIGEPIGYFLFEILVLIGVSCIGLIVSVMRFQLE
ncbi:MAG: ABC transporter permease [Methanosarcinales archaeon]|nr:ABC transporter permease [Methanosarcinales archaeon]